VGFDLGLSTVFSWWVEVHSSTRVRSHQTMDGNACEYLGEGEGEGFSAAATFGIFDVGCEEAIGG
jgi:hypothetical protein